MEPTNLIGAGGTIAGSAAVSIASQLGVGFADGIGRIPIPRLPIGLGSLTVEAEALDRRHQQRAAMVWGGAANSFTSQPRFAASSDPYDLAGEFGQDFGYFMARGEDPFLAPNTLPTWDRIRVTILGEAPLDPDCEAFGRAPGIDGIAADYIGLPPNTPTRDRPSPRGEASAPPSHAHKPTATRHPRIGVAASCVIGPLANPLPAARPAPLASRTVGTWPDSVPRRSSRA